MTIKFNIYWELDEFMPIKTLKNDIGVKFCQTLVGDLISMATIKG